MIDSNRALPRGMVLPRAARFRHGWIRRMPGGAKRQLRQGDPRWQLAHFDTTAVMGLSNSFILGGCARSDDIARGPMSAVMTPSSVSSDVPDRRPAAARPGYRSAACNWASRLPREIRPLGYSRPHIRRRTSSRRPGSPGSGPRTYIPPAPGHARHDHQVSQWAWMLPPRTGPPAPSRCGRLVADRADLVLPAIAGSSRGAAPVRSAGSSPGCQGWAG
jgi:hypothetical protein